MGLAFVLAYLAEPRPEWVRAQEGEPAAPLRPWLMWVARGALVLGFVIVNGGALLLFRSMGAS